MAKGRKEPTVPNEEGSSDEPAVPDFEAALEALERIIERLERGDLTLDVSLKEFERGVRLSRTCHEALRQAEQRVQQLLEEEGQLRFDDFDPPPES